VLEYQVELHEPIAAPHVWQLEPPFFRLTLVDSLDGTMNSEEYILVRKHTAKLVDRNFNGDVLTVGYGNVEQAMVATVKEALVHSKRLTVGWEDEIRVDTPTGRKILLLVRLSR
jgi:hypothetical protein